MFSLLKDFYISSIPSLIPDNLLRYARKNVPSAALSALLVCTGLCGCGGVVTKSAQIDALMPSTTDLSFGDVPIGQTVSSTVSLVNQGTGTVELSQLQVSGGSFTLDGQVALPISVPRGGAVNVNLTFDPSSAGSADGQLSVASNSSAPAAMVKLHGNGTSPLTSLSCTSGAMTGAGTDACTVTLKSAAPAGGQVVSLLSNNPSVSVPSSVTVPAKGIAVGFTATIQSVTSAQTAGLTATVAKNSESFAIKLNPVQPILSISSSSVNFGTVAVGTVAAQALTLTSTGNGAVTVSSGSTTGSGFTLIGASFPLTLNPGQSASLAVQFNPAATGTSSGQLALSSNSSTGSVTTIGLSGTATPALSALTCGTASYTGAGSDACTVNLNAAAPAGGTVVSLSSNQAAVTVPSSVTVSAGSASAGFTAAVSSVSTAEVVAVTAALGNAAQSFNIQLRAATPTLSVNTTTIAFGNVNVGQTATQSVTLSSTGTVPVIISSISVAGSLFTATGITTPLTLNPGQTATVALQFRAPEVSNFTGVVTVASNSSQGNVSVNMTAAGVAAPTLSALSCGTAAYTGSGTDVCTVSLTGAAPTGGQTISLSSNNPAITVPATVSVPNGATSAGFSATVSSVTSAQSATLTASSGTVTQSFAIQLNSSISTLGISSSTVAFGSVSVNSTSAQTVTLTSTGTAPITITSATVTGAGFTLTGPTFPIALTAGQTTTLNLTFAPTSAGSLTGQLAIASNSSTGNATASLSGTGVPVLSSLSCGTMSFTGSGSDACTVSLNAAAPAGGTVVMLSSNQTAMSVLSSVTVPAGSASAGFTATVTSVSTAEAVTLSATLGSVSKTSAIQLNAAIPTLAVSTSTVAFGNLIIGQTGTQTVTLSSIGTAPVTISSISVFGSLFNAIGLTTPLTLNPGQTANLTASFSPLIAEPYNYTGTITIASNSATNPSALVNMNGAGIAASTLTALSCSTSSYSAAGTDACTVTLSGAAPGGGYAVALSSNNSAVVVPSSVTVASGATSVAISANVSAVTTSQSAVITATAGGLTQTFAIQLGTAAGSLSINATTVPFGEMVANSTAAQSITLTATGTSSVTVNAASITGTGFSVSGVTFPVTLNPGQTITLNIQFAPMTQGSYTGQLTISSNCTGGNISVALSGTADPHQVQLSWMPPSSTSDPVVGYNIYRAITGSSSYQLINTAEDFQSTYSDTTVVHATSYAYYVKSVDASGAESLASNTTSVTIP